MNEEDAEWLDFDAMLPEYALKGHGVGFMHDSAIITPTLKTREPVRLTSYSQSMNKTEKRPCCTGFAYYSTNSGIRL
jgi:hypothetical protein